MCRKEVNHCRVCLNFTNLGEKHVIVQAIFRLPTAPLVILAHRLQMVEEMETEFGISCPSGLPKDLYQEDILDLEKRDFALRSTLQSHKEELERAQSTFSLMEEEKNKVEEKVLFMMGVRQHIQMLESI